MWPFSSRKNRATKPATRPSSLRPTLEALEDRCLLSAGNLDPTFGAGAGYVTGSLTNSNDYGASVVTQSNGTLIQSGLVATTGGTAKHPTTTYNVALTAYNPDGSLDTAFGSSGKVIGPTAKNGNVAVNDVLYPSTDPNGNGGKVLVTGVNGFAVARYNANGTLDTTFGSSGVASANFGTTLGTDYTTSAVIQSDGKIIVLGLSANDSTAELARFNADGSLDKTFGSNGMTTIAVPQASALLLQPSGEMVVVGWAKSSGGSPYGMKMAELNADGTLNTAFGSSGYVTNTSVNGAAAANNAILDPTGTSSDDQILVITQASSGGWELLRYNADGTPDTTFGSGGTTVSSFSGFPVSVAVQADGKIVVAGNSSSDVRLARYNADGSLDSSFGSGGSVLTQIGSQFHLYSNAGEVALDSNGDILVAGSTYNGSKWNFALARYLPSEPLISSFTSSPTTATAGSSVTLTAAGITDSNPSATIKQVAFYLDSNNDGTLETSGTNADKLLGTGTFDPSTGQWTFTWSTTGLTAGTYKLFAQAEDSDSVFGDPFSLSVTLT